MFTKHSVIFACCLLFISPLSFAQADIIGRVLIATQGVTAQQPQGEVRPLSRKAAVYLGDTLITPEGGKAQIRLNDGELIALTPATQLILEDFNYTSQASNNTSVKNLVTGGLRSISGVVGGEGYQVKTRAGTIGIRGTAYEAFTQQGNNLYVRMQRGDASVKNSRGEVLIGINQPLAAARIIDPNAKPEAIGFSALPEFFNQNFNAEATLSLAEDATNEATASNETPTTQLEEAALATADSTTAPLEMSSTEPPAATAATAAHLTTQIEQSDITSPETNSAKLDQAQTATQVATNPEPPTTSPEPPISNPEDPPLVDLEPPTEPPVEPPVTNPVLPPVNPEPPPSNTPNGNYRGYVLQETYNLEAGDIEYKNATGIIEAAYFKGAEYNQDSNDFVSFILGEAYGLNDGEVNTLASQPFTLQQLFDAPDINNLTFTGLLDFSYPPGLSESELEDLEGFNLYTVYDFLDLEKPDTRRGEIYYGYHIEKVDTGSAPSYKFSTFAFSEDILLLDEVNSLPLIEEYSYTLRNATEQGLSNESELKVNFATKVVSADITHNLIQGAYTGTASLTDFYTQGIELENIDQTGFSGNLKGQLAGSNANGAITLYELNSGTSDFKAGIGIFTRQ